MTGTIARSTPYAWPYDGRFEPTRLALVVVLPAAVGADAAVDGELPDPALSRIGELAGAVLHAGGVVLEVTTTRPLVGPLAGATPERRAAATGLKAPTARIASAGVDGFYGSTLDATLRALGRDQLLLAGQWLETGVHSTMRSANDRGYECLLVLDACVAFDPELVGAARSQIEMSGGIFGAVGDSDAVLEAIAAADPDAARRDSTPSALSSSPQERTSA